MSDRHSTDGYRSFQTQLDQLFEATEKHMQIAESKSNSNHPAPLEPRQQRHSTSTSATSSSAAKADPRVRTTSTNSSSATSSTRRRAQSSGRPAPSSAIAAGETPPLMMDENDTFDYHSQPISSSGVGVTPQRQQQAPILTTLPVSPLIGLPSSIHTPHPYTSSSAAQHHAASAELDMLHQRYDMLRSSLEQYRVTSDNTVSLLDRKVSSQLATVSQRLSAQMLEQEQRLNAATLQSQATATQQTLELRKKLKRDLLVFRTELENWCKGETERMIEIEQRLSRPPAAATGTSPETSAMLQQIQSQLTAFAAERDRDRAEIRNLKANLEVMHQQQQQQQQSSSQQQLTVSTIQPLLQSAFESEAKKTESAYKTLMKKQERYFLNELKKSEEKRVEEIDAMRKEMREMIESQKKEQQSQLQSQAPISSEIKSELSSLQHHLTSVQNEIMQLSTTVPTGEEYDELRQVVEQVKTQVVEVRSNVEQAKKEATAATVNAKLAADVAAAAASSKATSSTHADAEILQLRSSLDDMKSSVNTTINEKLASIDQRLTSNTTSITQLKKDVETAETDRAEEMKSMSDSFTKQFHDQLTHHSEQQAQNLTILRTDLISKQDALKEMLQEEMTTMVETVGEVEKRIGKMEEELVEKIEQVQKNDQSTNQSNVDSETITHLQDRVTNLEADLNQLNQSKEAVEKKQQYHDDKIVLLQSGDTLTKKEIGRIESRCNEIEKQQEEKITKLRQEVMEGTKKQLGEVDEKWEGVEKKVEELANEVAEVKSTATSAASPTSDPVLTESLTTLSSHFSTFRTTFTEYEAYTSGELQKHDEWLLQHEALMREIQQQKSGSGKGGEGDMGISFEQDENATDQVDDGHNSQAAASKHSRTSAINNEKNDRMYNNTKKNDDDDDDPANGQDLLEPEDPLEQLSMDIPTASSSEPLTVRVSRGYHLQPHSTSTVPINTSHKSAEQAAHLAVAIPMTRPGSAQSTISTHSVHPLVQEFPSRTPSRMASIERAVQQRVEPVVKTKEVETEFTFGQHTENESVEDQHDEHDQDRTDNEHKIDHVLDSFDATANGTGGLGVDAGASFDLDPDSFIEDSHSVHPKHADPDLPEESFEMHVHNGGFDHDTHAHQHPQKHKQHQQQYPRGDRESIDETHEASFEGSPDDISFSAKLALGEKKTTTRTPPLPSNTLTVPQKQPSSTTQQQQQQQAQQQQQQSQQQQQQVKSPPKFDLFQSPTNHSRNSSKNISPPAVAILASTTNSKSPTEEEKKKQQQPTVDDTKLKSTTTAAATSSPDGNNSDEAYGADDFETDEAALAAAASPLSLGISGSGSGSPTTATDSTLSASPSTTSVIPSAASTLDATTMANVHVVKDIHAKSFDSGLMNIDKKKEVTSSAAAATGNGEDKKQKFSRTTTDSLENSASDVDEELEVEPEDEQDSAADEEEEKHEEVGKKKVAITSEVPKSSAAVKVEEKSPSTEAELKNTKPSDATSISPTHSSSSSQQPIPTTATDSAPPRVLLLVRLTNLPLTNGHNKPLVALFTQDTTPEDDATTAESKDPSVVQPTRFTFSCQSEWLEDAVDAEFSSPLYFTYLPGQILKLNVYDATTLDISDEQRLGSVFVRSDDLFQAAEEQRVEEEEKMRKRLEKGEDDIDEEEEEEEDTIRELTFYLNHEDAVKNERLQGIELIIEAQLTNEEEEQQGFPEEEEQQEEEMSAVDPDENRQQKDKHQDQQHHLRASSTSSSTISAATGLVRDHTVRIRISCKGLPVTKDTSTCDPIVAAFMSGSIEKDVDDQGEDKQAAAGDFSYVSQTEWQRSTTSPEFTDTLILTHTPFTNQLVKFSVYDVSSESVSDEERIGSVLVKMDDIFLPASYAGGDGEAAHSRNLSIDSLRTALLDGLHQSMVYELLHDNPDKQRDLDQDSATICIRYEHSSLLGDVPDDQYAGKSQTTSERSSARSSPSDVGEEHKSAPPISTALNKSKLTTVLGDRFEVDESEDDDEDVSVDEDDLSSHSQRSAGGGLHRQRAQQNLLTDTTTAAASSGTTGGSHPLPSKKQPSPRHNINAMLSAIANEKFSDEEEEEEEEVQEKEEQDDDEFDLPSPKQNVAPTPIPAAVAATTVVDDKKSSPTKSSLPPLRSSLPPLSSASSLPPLKSLGTLSALSSASSLAPKSTLTATATAVTPSPATAVQPASKPTAAADEEYEIDEEFDIDTGDQDYEDDD